MPHSNKSYTHFCSLHVDRNMGQRKLWFSNQKNYETKKTAQNSSLVVRIPIKQWWNHSSRFIMTDFEQPASKLKVTIPIDIFLQQKFEVTDIKILFERIRQIFDISPNGRWAEETRVITGCVPCTTSYVIKKLQEFGELQLTLVSDCSWTMQVNDHKISLPSSRLFPPNEQTLKSVDIMTTILKKLDSSVL